jgi:1,4-dihydroxy-2-naphthoate octaprenyltransferase
MLRYLVYMLRIRRVEYRVAEVPILLIPVLLTLRDVTPLTTLPFWEGVLVFFFLFAFGDLVNCLADRDLDARYKPHLTEAVYGLGVGMVKGQAVFSAMAALVLAAHVGWVLDRWILLAATAVGLLLGLAYSIEPVRLKGRGLAQPLFFWVGLFVGPMAFAALLVDPMPPAEVYVFAAAYGLLQTGIILVNTAEDYAEDRQAAVGTVIVTLGLPRGIALALSLIVLGSVGLLATLGVIFWQRAVPLAALAGLVPIAVACAWVYRSVRRLRHEVAAAAEEEGIRAVKRSGKWVPGWVTSVALGSLVAALASWV